MSKNINSDKSLVISVAFACLLSILYLLKTCDCLIITSVIAGNKKFKTVSFDHPWIKPLTFEKDLPFSTEFRRTQTVRAPKFDVDINVPIKLPVEDEYAYEEPRKPVVSDFFLETSEHKENNNYNKKNNNNHDYEQKISNNNHKRPQYGQHQQQDQQQEYDSSRNYDSKKQQPMTYADSNTNFQYVKLPTMRNNNNKLVTQQQQQSIINPVHHQQVFGVGANPTITEKISRSDDDNSIHTQTVRNHLSDLHQQHPRLLATRRQQAGNNNDVVQYDDQPISKSAPNANSNLVAQDSSNNYNYANNANYKEPKYPHQEFVPGGFINLQLSGPTGGPKMTHEDYDRLNWARQVSQTEHAMPFPVLNYQQLQNFYGGLGTFTNGLPETRYHEDSLLDKLKSSVTHFTDKLHIG